MCERVVSWVVFSFCPSSYVRPQLLDAFLRQLVFMAGQRGITMGRPLEVLEGSPTGDVELLLHSCAERCASYHPSLATAITPPSAPPRTPPSPQRPPHRRNRLLPPSAA